MSGAELRRERASGLRAGTAWCDLTTDAKGARVRDPLLAKVLVLDDGHTRVGIVAMDTTAIGGRAISRGALSDVGEQFLPTLRARVEEDLGIPGASLLVNASHTHPPGPLLCDDAAQVERVFDAPPGAGGWSRRVGAELAASRITMNRTLRLKNGKHWTLRHAHPSPPDEEVAAALSIPRSHPAGGSRGWPAARGDLQLRVPPLFGDVEEPHRQLPGIASV